VGQHEIEAAGRIPGAQRMGVHVSIFEWTITGAPATYLLHFGENYRHFHALVAARGADIPAGQRGGNILGLCPGHVDVAAAIALVPTVRASDERTAPGASDRGSPGPR